MHHWLVKQEPESYSWSQFVGDRGAAWTGIRSFPARLHLRAMNRGDLVAFYHSGTGKCIVGVAKVTREHYPDPTSNPGEKTEWCCVDLQPVCPLKNAVTLPAIKADPILKSTELVRQTRLSVMPLTSQQFNRILELGNTTIDKKIAALE